ncbi:MAG TPA: hypothetical protein VFC17_06655 [Candidatus Limnocylindrales bacterium]|nr:hypothetical protein [Candidatus Limnocylindrales bacterium]
MKTPRDILFARHQAAAPKLDAIRQSAVAAVCDRRISADGTDERRSQTAAPTILQTFWRELIFPCHRIWAGLATMWVLIFIINFSQRDNVSSVTGKPVRSGGAVMSLQAQQRLMNELLADRSMPPETDPPRNFSPKPRTETSETTTV